jgi:hypothetical protein
LEIGSKNTCIVYENKKKQWENIIALEAQINEKVIPNTPQVRLERERGDVDQVARNKVTLRFNQK